MKMSKPINVYVDIAGVFGGIERQVPIGHKAVAGSIIDREILTAAGIKNFEIRIGGWIVGLNIKIKPGDRITIVPKP